MRLTILFFLVSVGGLGGCGGSPDARCQSLCTIKEPSISDAYDICSQDSVDSCVKDCEAHIAGVSSLCATCLLESACFDGMDCGSVGLANCGSGQCTVTGRVGQCSYQQNDRSAYENCVRQVYPRREVQCRPLYQSVSKCASVC